MYALDQQNRTALLEALEKRIAGLNESADEKKEELIVLQKKIEEDKIKLKNDRDEYDRQQKKFAKTKEKWEIELKNIRNIKINQFFFCNKIM